jgi:hypothetical protein
MTPIMIIIHKVNMSMMTVKLKAKFIRKMKSKQFFKSTLKRIFETEEEIKVTYEDTRKKFFAFLDQQ